MGLETFTGLYIDGLNTNWPLSSDNLSQGDNHIAGIKLVLQNTFPNITGPVTATQAELNILDGVTSTAAELNIMDGSATTQATVTLAGTDGVVISDGDVMTQCLVSDFETYMEANIDSLTSLTAVGTITTGVWNGTAIATGDIATTLTGKTLTTATLTSPVINTGVSGTAIDTTVTTSTTKVPHSNAVKTYVDSVGITATFKTSAYTSYAGGTTFTGKAHGQGSAPDLVFATAECTTADGAYAVGDVVNVNQTNTDSAYGVEPGGDATNLFGQVGSLGICLSTSGGASGVANVITAGNWNIYITGIWL